MAVQVGVFTGIQQEPDPTDDSSNPEEFPSFFNDVHLSELQPKVIPSYASVAERDAQGAPMSGTSAFAFTRDTGTLWAYWANAWKAMFSANGGAWSASSVTWSSMSAGVATTLAVNSGSVSLRQSQDGKTVTGTVVLTRGGNTNLGGGDYVFKLPSGFKQWMGVAGTGIATIAGASGTQKTFPFVLQGIGGNSVALVRPDGSRIGTYTGSSDGKTGVWAAGDVLTFTYTYEAS